MAIDFAKTIYENRKANGAPFLAAHRGMAGANIPCNSMAAFKIAIDEGADVIELDVAKSKDGKFFVFHPGTEKIFLGSERLIADMDSSEVEELYLLNSDRAPTSYKVPTLNEALSFLKGKAYINVDKFWIDVKGIADEIRRAGVESQVIVKTFTDKESLAAVVKYAPDFMFMPLVRKVDQVTEWLISEGVNVIGAEILFDSESDEVISDAYIEKMHLGGLLIWSNSIVYNEKEVISAYHTDDISLTDSPEKGWGWLIDKNVDFIQTDWLPIIKKYVKKRILK